MSGVSVDHGDGAYAWDRSFRLWDSYFAVVWAATLVFVLGTDFPGWHTRAVATALLVPLAPWYVLVGRPILKGEPPDERRALGYLVGCLAELDRSDVTDLSSPPPPYPPPLERSREWGG
ncbi:hypothetical protein ACTMUQ_17885 [Streptomyces sp. SD11]|uniref:hypothetical protein n=1 Tax=Streptomyces sp. SD11 TaxID=3452209 RepID=UPI003F8B5DFC